MKNAVNNCSCPESDADALMTINDSKNLSNIVIVGKRNSGKFSIIKDFIIDEKKNDDNAYEVKNCMICVPIKIIRIEDKKAEEYVKKFDNSEILILTVDVSEEFDDSYIYLLKTIIQNAQAKPEIHVFLHKSDLQKNEVMKYQNEIDDIIPNCNFHITSINDCTSSLALSFIIEGIIPKISNIKTYMKQFITSLSIISCLLIEVKTKLIIASSGDKLDADSYFLLSKGVEMFHSVRDVYECRCPSSNLSLFVNEKYHHIFLVTPDMVLVCISNYKIPITIAKNNLVVLLKAITHVYHS